MVSVSVVSFFVGTILYQVAINPAQPELYQWTSVKNNASERGSTWFQSFLFQCDIPAFAIQTLHDDALTHVNITYITGNDHGGLTVGYAWIGNSWTLRAGSFKEYNRRR